MNKYLNIQADRVLIFGDIHQDLNWAKLVIDTERGNYDHIICLGDFFDSFYDYPKVVSVRAMAKFVIELIDEKYGPSTITIGNHDAAYMESYKYNAVYTNPRHLFTACSGYTKNKSKDINGELTLDHWKEFQLFCVCNGFLISHAGFAESFWQKEFTTETNLNRLYKESNDALYDVLVKPNCYSKFFAAGLSRGGKETVGGPTWLDWNYDFVDCLPLPQIVGHTSSPKRIGKIGRSYCIDGMQSTYCILHKDGNIEFKSTSKDFKTIESKPMHSTHY